MKLIDFSAKQVMEHCKRKAEEAGLKVGGGTLEFIVGNRELIGLETKMMIPTLFDHPFQQVENLGKQRVYEIFPHNPYETVINTSPPISFYNQDNPDWLNYMIFYHVLGHIDYFRTNVFFEQTWLDDFCGQALADRRTINKIREELGAEKRWVDYVIEFSWALGNLVGYYSNLKKDLIEGILEGISPKTRFYFSEFLKNAREKNVVGASFYFKEVERYNQCVRKWGAKGETFFFDDISFKSQFPEFEELFRKYEVEKNKRKTGATDILEWLIENSPFVNKVGNEWMKVVIEIVRRTCLYFEPQIRTKICNEGWASLWHTRLALSDERIIKGNEIDFALVNSKILLGPRFGLNPYIIGMNLWEFIEDLACRGRLSHEFYSLTDIEQRKQYNRHYGNNYAKMILFELKSRFNDFLLINFLPEREFQEFVDKHQLFVAGIQPTRQPSIGKVYIKSRNGEEVRKVLNGMLYHPPAVNFSEYSTSRKPGVGLYLNHLFEGRQLVRRYIPLVLRGLAFLIGGFDGGEVKLETTEFMLKNDEWVKVRVLYVASKEKIERQVIGDN